MLGWFRSRSGLLAVPAICVVLLFAASAVAPHAADCHDSECVPVVLDHDASTHAVSVPSGEEPHPLHCVLCHLMRSFRPRAGVVHHLAPPTADAFVVHVVIVSAPSAFLAAQPPLRSPPPESPAIG